MLRGWKNSKAFPAQNEVERLGRAIEEADEKLLASCYHSCLELAEQNGVRSVAFCCISTGVFMFPNERAAEIAVETVRKYYEETGSEMKVVFDVFKEEDLAIYSRILSDDMLG